MMQIPKSKPSAIRLTLAAVNLIIGMSVLVSSAYVYAGSSNNQTVNKPNILFISIDDFRTDLPVYGANHVKAPHLNALAQQGRAFNRHYVQVPTCGPSRATLLTGKNLLSKNEIQHGYLGRKLKNKPEGAVPETFIHHLKRNGYYTVGMGKISHNADGTTNDKGQLELPNSWSKFLHLESKHWTRQEIVHGYAYGKKLRTDKDSNGNLQPPYEMADVPDDAYPDGTIATLAVQELQQRQKENKPFFMAVGFVKPHLPFTAPKKYWDLYDAAKIPLSPNPERPIDVAKEFLHPSVEFFKQYHSPEKGGAGKRLSDEYARKLIHGNLASISYVDTQVGKVLAQLKKSGLADNTIIIVWGDHGWHLGDQTIWGKHSTFERALNSTLLVKTPEMKQAGINTDALVASIDIYPTICDLTNITCPNGIDGKSFKAAIDNPNQQGKKGVLSYWRNIVSMRTEQYRLAVFNNGKSQKFMLFDHDTDPIENINIADKHPEIVKQLMPLMKKLNNGYLPSL
jgi:arylsulfatase A-like enzyme